MATLSTTAKALKIGDTFTCKYGITARVIDIYDSEGTTLVVYVPDFFPNFQIQKLSEVK